jgi:hypothetical protein
MDWTQVLTIVGSNMVLFLWSRAESRSDMRMMLSIIDGIRQEIKDFHGRLCSLEEKKKKEK